MKGAWAEELPCVLWSYRTTIHLDTKEMHFQLMFRQDAFILVEIEQTIDRISSYSNGANNQLRLKNLDFLEEDR